MLKGQDKRFAALTTLVGVAGLIVIVVAYLWWGRMLIEAAYDGRSLELFNRSLAEHRATRPYGTLEHYVTLGRVLFSRFLLGYVAVVFLMMALVMHRRTTALLRAFFTASTHPINLAIFRIVLFGTILTSLDITYVTLLSQTPAELLVPPVGVGWLLQVIPINPIWAEVSARLLLCTAFLAMIGFHARTFAAATAVLSVYVLGIPQFYGKVDHYHHLVWFAAILAASRCADALSVDALIAAWRNADRGNVEPPGPSRVYALPLRFVWLLLGVIYFFAGVWKWWSAGFDWALSDNLRFIMYEKWTQLAWTPTIRIDQYPFVYKAAALGTIAFEISFIFLLFSRRLRVPAALAGITFHAMTHVFMRISFASLMRCYVVFFDWHTIGRSIGGVLFRQEASVLYDGSCAMCRRTVALLRVFDVLHRLKYVNVFDRNEVRQADLDWLDSNALMQDMHVVVGRHVRKGFAAYRALALRMPLSWPVLPFLYVWPVPIVGNRIYRRVADGRTCSLVRRQSIASHTTSIVRTSGQAAAVAVGVALLGGNIFAGAAHVTSAWPLAGYPTFEGIQERSETELLEISLIDGAGKAITLDTRAATDQYGTTRFYGMVSQVLSATNEDERRIRSAALSRLWTRNNLSVPHRGRIRFYRLTLSTVPEDWQRNPRKRELILELPL